MFCISSCYLLVVMGRAGLRFGIPQPVPCPWLPVPVLLPNHGRIEKTVHFHGRIPGWLDGGRRRMAVDQGAEVSAL